MDIELFQRVAKKINSEYFLVEAKPLEGGLSAQTYLLDISSPTGDIKYVFRQHGDYDFSLNPNIATNEFNLLKLLENKDNMIWRSQVMRLN